jgi:hypothetical protein
MMMMHEEAVDAGLARTGGILLEDVQFEMERIFDQEPNKAGYELAGLIYQLLDQREKEHSRKSLSLVRMSLFSMIDDKWDSIEKGTFFLAYSLRWMRGYEKFQQSMLEKFEELEREVDQRSRKE